MTQTTIVWGATVLTGFDDKGVPCLAKNAGIVCVDGLVKEVGPIDYLRQCYPAAELVGGPDFAVTPGFINAHHHVGLTPLQLGSADLTLELWFTSRLALRDVDLHGDTLFSAFEMIASGVTTVQHLHSRAPGTPQDILAAAEQVILAYRQLGMRASYSMALRDQNRLVYEADQDFVARLPKELRPAMSAYFQRFTVPLEAQVEVFTELMRRYRHDPLIQIQVAPSNLHWLSDKALETAGELSHNSGAPIHMHVLETPYQKAYALKRTGGSALDYLNRSPTARPFLPWQRKRRYATTARRARLSVHVERLRRRPAVLGPRRRAPVVCPAVCAGYQRHEIFPSEWLREVARDGRICE